MIPERERLDGAHPDLEVQRLRRQIEDLRQLLTAIQGGDVDAVVLGGPAGEQLYTLVSADRPYRVIVEQMGEAAVTVSARGIVLYVNRRLTQMVGRTPGALLGCDVSELVPDGSAAVLAELLTAGPGETRRAELELVGADGGTVPVLATVTGLQMDDVVVRCLIAADLTDQRRDERTLATAYDQLRRSAEELEEAQRIGRIGNWYWDAATHELTWTAQMYRIYGLDPASPRAASRAAVAAATHPEDVPLGAAARDRALADHEPFVLEQRLVHPDGDLRHVVTRGEVVTTADGAVVGMRGTTQDVTEQRRAATAAAAAREQLLRRTIELAEEHRVKEALQRAVLPRALPVRAGIELAARYLAADRPALVGGDWYDAYGLPDGSLALAVGDVVGHDLDAAATMGQLRNALRAYAATGEPPARVLTRLNQLTTQAQGGLATVVYGRLAPDLRAFRWASAGHPPPLLLTESGTSFLTPAAGAMLGAHPSTPYGTVRTPLRAGQTLLLYTDGLIERRDRDLDTGSALLADATHDLGGLPLDAVCDTLLSRLLPDQAHEDDVCLLTLRLTSPPLTQAIARSSPGRAVPVRRVGKRPQVT